jgi:hypothetical protein
MDNSRQRDNDLLATKDIGGVKSQRVQVQFGGPGEVFDVSGFNPLPVKEIPFELATLLNLIDNGATRLVNIFARTVIGTSPGDVWAFGGSYQYLTDASFLTVESSSVNDTGAGTGARTVLIRGLDADFETQEETLTLNGTSPVQTSLPYIRFLYAEVRSAGSLGRTSGNLTIRSVSGNLVQGYMVAGTNETRLSHYTVPAGKIGIIKHLYINQFAQQERTCRVTLEHRPQGQVFTALEELSAKQAHVYYPVAYRVEEKTDVVMRAVSDQASTVISGGYQVFLFDKEEVEE